MNNAQRLSFALLPFRRAAESVCNTLAGNGLPIRPYYASLDVTYRCNLKCTHCGLWERPAGEEELTLDELKHIVLQLKKWLSLPAIDVLGGEAFVRPDTMELLRFATEQGMFIHMVTNGTMLSERLARELIEMNVHKIAISLDGYCAQTHDTTRGVKGALRRAVRGVERLKRWKDELGGGTRITIQTILNASTLDEIPSMLEWVAAKGLDGFHLIPLDQNVGGIDHASASFKFDDQWFDRNPLWIRDINKLQRVIDHVIRKKRERYPVADPITYLQHTIPYFRDSEGVQHYRPCRVGSELAKVSPKGDLVFCPYEPPIGNLRVSSLDDLWVNAQAGAAREKARNCRNKCFIPFCAWNERERMGRFWDQFVMKPRSRAGIQRQELVQITASRGSALPPLPYTNAPSGRDVHGDSRLPIDQRGPDF